MSLSKFANLCDLANLTCNKSTLTEHECAVAGTAWRNWNIESGRTSKCFLQQSQIAPTAVVRATAVVVLVYLILGYRAPGRTGAKVA